MHPEEGRDYSIGPKEIGGVVYLAVAGFAVWLLGVRWGIGIFVGVLVLHAIVVGVREGRRRALTAAIRDGRVRTPVLVARDAAQRGDIKLLVSLLTDPEGRLSATLLLGNLRARDAVPQLMRNLTAHNDLDRNAAANALGKIGDPSAIPALQPLPREDPSAMVRITAIDALATLGDRDGTQMLNQLASDPAPLLGDAERLLQVQSLRKAIPGSWRKTRKFAAKRLRQLNDTQTLP